MGFTRDLLAGIAEHLDAAGVAVWRPTGVYLPDETAIFIATLPEHPGAVLTLTGYAIDDAVLPDSVVGVQVRTRAPGRDPSATDDLGDDAFDALHGLGPIDLNGVHIQLCTRASSLPMGMDSSARFERSDNYRVMVHRPGTYRL